MRLSIGPLLLAVLLHQGLGEDCFCKFVDDWNSFMQLLRNANMDTSSGNAQVNAVAQKIARAIATKQTACKNGPNDSSRTNVPSAPAPPAPGPPAPAPPAPAPPAGFVCQTTWVKHGAFEYNFCPSPQSTGTQQQVAEQYCLSVGSHLASIHSSDEALFIASHFPGRHKAMKMQIAIGLIKRGGAWGWTDGTPFDYVAWAPGEPNGAYSRLPQECGFLLTGEADHARYNDDTCTRQVIDVVCKRPAA